VKENSLPLGIDIGATRVRVVAARMALNGPRVHGVAVREVSPGASSSGSIVDTQYVAAVIEDALTELGTRERRCVASIGEPDALLRSVRFPKMTKVERERSARFEAQRYVDFPLREALIRIHPVLPSDNLWALGIARTTAVTTRVAALRAARLKVVSIDHEASALARCLPFFDAIVDIGFQRASLHVVTEATPATFQTFNGGADVTRGIERELSIDERSAEKRKRILGTAGAGERARAVLTADVAALIHNARQTHPISRVAMVGNGARLPGFADDLQGATGALFELPVSDALRGSEYPEDVVRSSAPDWTLAAGLALWGQR
jgi:Tfp pilus assembly PilM family ATPase